MIITMVNTLYYKHLIKLFRGQIYFFYKGYNHEGLTPKTNNISKDSVTDFCHHCLIIITLIE
jgi:hypothetical protein